MLRCPAARDATRECRELIPRASACIAAAPGAAAGLELLLKAVYSLYADYVLKNPFYELDMPIKCDKFDERLGRLLHDFSR
jgi:hypothetical protein